MLSTINPIDDRRFSNYLDVIKVERSVPQDIYDGTQERECRRSHFVIIRERTQVSFTLVSGMINSIRHTIVKYTSLCRVQNGGAIIHRDDARSLRVLNG